MKFLFYFNIKGHGTTDGGYCKTIDELIDRIKKEIERIKHHNNMEINISLKLLEEKVSEEMQE